MLTLHYTAAVRSLLNQDDPHSSWPRLRELCADISRLRRIHLASRRVELQAERVVIEATRFRLDEHRRDQAELDQIRQGIRDKQAIIEAIKATAPRHQQQHPPTPAPTDTPSGS